MCRSAFINALVCAARWCLEVISHRNTSREIDFLRRISSTLLLCFLCAAFGVAQETKLLPPSQAVAPAIASAHSGSKPSGAGKRWSNWYRLGVGQAPSGYTVQKTEFWLSGDHVCGASAECREIARDGSAGAMGISATGPYWRSAKNLFGGAYSSVLQRSIKCIAISARLANLLSFRPALK